MDKTSLYIQKLIVLLLVFIAGVLLNPVLKIYYLIPSLFFSLGFLVSRITGQKPDFLFGLAKSDEFLNKKAGFWVLFKWILILFGLIFDLAAWTIFGVYVLYTVILDFILLIKTIIYWIIHAILWFLKQLVPPIVFLYKMIIYYLFLWSWWIYKLCFRNIGKSINLNFYYISLRGAVLMLFSVLLFYAAGILIGMPEIILIGMVFSVLPLVWSYGEISSLRFYKQEKEAYPLVRKQFRSGFNAVKAVLNYFIIFLFLALTEVVFNILGWIPQAGFSFMGLVPNINTMASLTLIFIFVILVFSKLILPPHIVYNKDFKPDFQGSISFLGVIGQRFLRYTLSSLPTVIFGFFTTVIPGIIIFLAIVITFNLKDSILDSRISMLHQRSGVLENIEKYKSNKEIERMMYYKGFPKNSIKGFTSLKSLRDEVKNLEENIVRGEKEIASLSREFGASIDSVNKRISMIETLPMVDSLASMEMIRLKSLKQERLDNFSKWRQDAEFGLSKKMVDLDDKKGFMVQLPLVFLLTIFWASFFGGIVMAFLVSYLGNVYFELYNFKEDNKPAYFTQVLAELNSADHNQPLLGFTLLLLFVPLAMYFTSISNAIKAFIFSITSGSVF